jgi:hypothetical protein
MPRVSAARALLLLLGCYCVAPTPARAQYDLEEEQRVWLRALLDVRVARGGSAPSWTDLGPGKTRYGGKDTESGFERTTRFVMSQLAIELSASLPWGMRAHAQVNVQPDLADDWDPWLIEAWLRKEWGNRQGFGLQAGLMNVPFSLEHVGPAWSPEYTISASALNSWLWEEISLAGLEAEWWHVTERGLRLGAIVGAGFGPDQLGRLLALRGWALGDGLSGLNSDLPLPSGERTDIFDERDDRPAAYTWLTLGDAGERVTLRFGYLDNGGDQDTEGVWNTHLETVGALLHPHPSLDLVVQYLRGEARIGDRSNDSSVRAFYALLSHHRGRHRFSVRYDEFRVEDVDQGNPTAERGDGITAAYLVEFGLRHRIALEYIWLDSHRPSRVPPEPSQDGWQVSYRFRY